MAAQRLLRLLPTDSFLAAAYGAAVEVPKTAGESEAGKLVWIQAAYEGDFKGYRFPMKLTAAFFSSLIDNLRRDPQFTKGADGYGEKPVVRMDYEHASAMPPTEGSIPASGTPAPGWVCDLETRPDKGGRVALWALCSLGDQLREQIKKEEYRFVSIDAPLKSKDPVTAQDRGPKLRALAMTNDPFLRDLEPASIAASMSQYGRAESPEELVIGLRQALELPEDAAPADIAKVVQDVGAAFEAGIRPPGYPDGLGAVVDCVRRLLGLPLLSSAAEIVAGAGQVLGALSASPSTPAKPANPEGTTMSDKIRQALVLLFGCVDHDDAILAAATKATGALAALGELMKKYGASDPSDLAAKALSARDDAAKVGEFATKLTEALAALDSGQEEEAKKETEQVAASAGFAGSDDPKGKAARSVILSQCLAARRAAAGIVLSADGKLAFGEKDPAKLEEFRKLYPTPDPQKVLLTSSIVATPGGQVGGAHTALPAGGAPPAGAAVVPKHIEEIQGYPGPNNVAKAIAMLSDKQAGFKLQPYSEQCRLAGNYVITGKAA